MKNIRAKKNFFALALLLFFAALALGSKRESLNGPNVVSDPRIFVAIAITVAIVYVLDEENFFD
jgi:hypothetical protein